MTAACAVAALLVAVPTEGALARPVTKPALQLILPSQATQGSVTPYSFTAKRVPRADKLVIQRQMGTARAYRTVAALSNVASGTGSLPALQLGVYRFRIAVLSARHGKTVVVATASTHLAVFGDIPLSTLFAAAAAVGGTYTTPTRTFPWAVQWWVTGSSVTQFTENPADSHCRSLNLDFVAESGHLSGDTVTLTVVQQASDPLAVSAAQDVISSLDVTLTPGQSWSVQTAATNFFGLNVDLNGTASCDQSS
jgi:hypothetical protein